MDNDNELREYVLNKNEEPNGSFLTYFLKACINADPFNWAMLRPVIQQVKEKYPLKRQQLNEQERP